MIEQVRESTFEDDPAFVVGRNGEKRIVEYNIGVVAHTAVAFVNFALENLSNKFYINGGETIDCSREKNIKSNRALISVNVLDDCIGSIPQFVTLIL